MALSKSPPFDVNIPGAPSWAVYRGFSIANLASPQRREIEAMALEIASEEQQAQGAPGADDGRADER